MGANEHDKYHYSVGFDDINRNHLHQAKEVLSRILFILTERYNEGIEYLNFVFGMDLKVSIRKELKQSISPLVMDSVFTEEVVEIANEVNALAMELYDFAK